MVRAGYFHCWGPGSIPDWRTKIHKLCGEAKKKKKHITVVNQSLVIPHVPSTFFLVFMLRARQSFSGCIDDDCFALFPLW